MKYSEGTSITDNQTGSCHLGHEVLRAEHCSALPFVSEGNQRLLRVLGAVGVLRHPRLNTAHAAAGAESSGHGLLNGIAENGRSMETPPHTLSTPAVLTCRASVSRCTRHTKRQGGGFSRTSTLPLLSTSLPPVLSVLCLASVATTWLLWPGLAGFAFQRQRANQGHLGRISLLRQGGSFFQRGCATAEVSTERKRQKAAARKQVKH